MPLDITIGNDAIEDARLANLETLKESFLHYPYLDGVLEKLDRLKRYGRAGNVSGTSARCMMLLGESGSGKTATLRHWLSKHPMRTERLADVYPALYVEVPPKPSLKALAEATLRGLGAPVARRSARWNLEDQVVDQLKEQGVEVIVFDEIQHLLSPRNRGMAYDAADFIKRLLNASVCPVVLAGLPEAAAIYSENEQLARRSLSFSRLSAFDWRNEEDRACFQALLDQFEASLPFEEPSNLIDDDLALRVHHASGGFLGRAIDFLFNAAILAIETDAPCLTRAVLSQTVEEGRNPTEADWCNPFKLSDAALGQRERAKADAARRGATA